MSDFADISVEEFKTLCAAGPVVVVDVRTDAEVARGVIPGRGTSCFRRCPPAPENCRATRLS